MTPELDSRIKYALTAVLLLICSSSFAHSDGGIVIVDAWVREAPPMAKVMAAYMNIENHTGQDADLIEVSTTLFNRVEIHKNITRNGMASMQRQEKLTIPSQGKINMQSDGYHLMLFNPTSKLKAGDSVNFILKFTNGTKSIIDATVKKGSAEHEHHHAHMDHSNMNQTNMNDTNLNDTGMDHDHMMGDVQHQNKQ